MQMYIVVGIMAFMIISFLINKWPFGVTAMTCVVLLVLTGIMDLEMAFSGFAMKELILIASMYVVSNAFSRTSMIAKIQNHAMGLQKNGKSSWMLVLLLIAVTILLSQFLPNSAAISVMIAIVVTLNDEGSVTRSRLIFPLAAISNIWGTKLPIGPGASGHMNINRVIEAYGPEWPLLGVTDTIRASIIPLVLLTIYTFLTYKMMPKRPLEDVEIHTKKRDQTPLRGYKEIIVYIVFVICVASMFMNSILGNIMYVVPATGVLIFLYTGVLTDKEVRATLSKDLVFMLAGVFMMAEALSITGAGEVIGNVILNMLGDNPSYLKLLYAFSTVGGVMTQFMNNSAATNVLRPLAVSTAVAAKMDPRGLALALKFCCGTAILFPMSAASTAMAFAAGRYKLKETFIWSLGFLLITLITVPLGVYLIFPGTL